MAPQRLPADSLSALPIEGACNESPVAADAMQLQCFQGATKIWYTGNRSLEKNL